MRGGLTAAVVTACLGFVLHTATSPADAAAAAGRVCPLSARFATPCAETGFAIFTDTGVGATTDKHLQVLPGTVVYGMLTENPDTGYLWTYLPPVGNPLVVEGYDRFTSGRADMPGGPGIHLFAFRVPRPPQDDVADQELVFALARPGTPPVRLLRVDVRVRNTRITP